MTSVCSASALVPSDNGQAGRDARVSAEHIANWLRLLFDPGQVTELRAVKVRRGNGRPHTEAGFFSYDHFDDMARAAIEVERYATGVYFSMNPLKPAILSRCSNRVQWAEEGKLAGDAHVLRRKWLLIDVDPVREVSDISSTDAEKEESRQVVLAVRTFLDDNGWPEPFFTDSGNGYHLLYPIDLPPDDGGLVKRVLEALASKFDSDQVKIDRTVANPARVTKLYGTLSRKGDHTEERPHRRSRILEALGGAL